MTFKILAALKERSKLSKKNYAKPSMINKEELNSYLKYCSEIIIDVKRKILNNLKVKLETGMHQPSHIGPLQIAFLTTKKFLLYLLFRLMVL